MQQTEAQRIAQRKYYEKNKLRINELHRDYYYNNKEALLRTKKIYYEKNKLRINEQQRDYYYNNKESLLRTKKITISHDPKTLYFS
jgi:hypothetical protein